MDIYQLIQEKREDIIRIAENHGASNIRIFGSVARNEMKTDSDIDFLVTFEEGRSLLDHAALILDLEDLLGRIVRVATERGLRQSLKKRIYAEAIPL